MAGFGYIRYKNTAALSDAEGFCAEVALASQMEHLTKPAAPVGVPCRVVGNDLLYKFSGFGNYSATCVVTQAREHVLSTRVAEER